MEIASGRLDKGLWVTSDLPVRPLSDRAIPQRERERDRERERERERERK